MVVNCIYIYIFVQRAIVKSSPEIVRSSLLPFFTFAADDLAHTVSNLKVGRFSHVKGTITRGIINPHIALLFLRTFVALGVKIPPGF